MSSVRYALPVTIRRAAFSGERLVLGDGWQQCVPVHRCLHRDWSPLNEREEPAEGEELAGLLEVGIVQEQSGGQVLVWLTTQPPGIRHLWATWAALVTLDWQARTRAAEARAARLAAALSLARTRLEICLGRFRGCTGEGHGVSEREIPGWLEEMERVMEATE